MCSALTRRMTKVMLSTDSPHRVVTSRRTPEYQYPWFRFYCASLFSACWMRHGGRLSGGWPVYRRAHRNAGCNAECRRLHESSCALASALLPVDVDSDHCGRLQLAVARAGGMGNDRACTMLRYAMDDVLQSGLSLRSEEEGGSVGEGVGARGYASPGGASALSPREKRGAIRRGGPEQPRRGDEGDARGACVLHDAPPGRVREVLVGHGRGAEAERQEGGETGAISRENQGQIPNGEGGARGAAVRGEGSGGAGSISSGQSVVSLGSEFASRAKNLVHPMNFQGGDGGATECIFKLADKSDGSNE